jgi:hypothetical protein
MMTKFIEHFDPTGEHHRALGYGAAEHLFQFCPNGHADTEMVNLVQAKTEAIIRKHLEPLGAGKNDLKCAVKLTAEHFGERYLDLVRAAHMNAGHA